jgi:hypothetical protein
MIRFAETPAAHAVKATADSLGGTLGEIARYVIPLAAIVFSIWVGWHFVVRWLIGDRAGRAWARSPEGEAWAKRWEERHPELFD